MNNYHAIQDKIVRSVQLLEERFLEREELIRLIMLGAAAGENVLLVGPPGTAKSQLARTVAQLFGGHWFEYLLTRFTTPEELFGPVSLQQLKQDHYVRQTDGFLPGASFAFLDEIFKANSAILNALLSILNERVFYNGRDKQPVPLAFLMAASNELPEENEQLEALYDRFLLRYEVGYLRHMSSYEKLFQLPEGALSPLLAVSDMENIREAASRVMLHEGMVYMLFQLKTALEAKDYACSDRRLKKIGDMWRISAAMNGRDAVNVWDTVFTPHMLWDYPEDLGTMKELFNTVFQDALKKEAQRELPLGAYNLVAAKWLEKEDELHAFQFKKEVGGKLNPEAIEQMKRLTEECREELEETARKLRGKLVIWQQRETDLPGYIRNQNFLVLHAEQYAVKYTHLRIEGERILQTLQGLYRTLFDRDIPGLHYDYTL
ncbi:AAA family ATPase [Paenibacillus thalictri]|uniref:ATPase n=1 Tax=Paenibacillus thalictri TaxID=2527873 RepID=A0A4Q9DTP8_9BACL|nr:AAA family ATPase [Paenibacillus thalictri]TBL80323.1 ATPase [Paenibacillus thalictri]